MVEEKLFPPRKDHIATFKKFKLLRLCAITDLDLLIAKSNSFIPSTNLRLAQEIEIEIAKQRQFVEKLDEVADKFANALNSYGQTMGKVEYQVFALLVVKGIPAKDVSVKLGVSVDYVHNLSCKFRKEINSLEVVNH